MKLRQIIALAGLSAALPLLAASSAFAQAGRSEEACMAELNDYRMRFSAKQSAFTLQEQERARSLLQVGESKCRGEGDRSFLSVSSETEFLRQKLEQAEASTGTAPPSGAAR